MPRTNILLHMVNGNSDDLQSRYEEFTDGRTQYFNRLIFHAAELWEGIAM